MGEAAQTSRLAPGAIVAERYRIESVLGEGGMGVVYLAEHVHMRKRVALKVLLPEWVDKAEVLARFEREAVAAGKIEHANVARATDFGRLADGSFFLVLEYVAGQSLRDVLKAGAMPQERALHIARGIAAAASAAHAHGIVHRDLKPENVMLIEQDGDADFVKVLDFGIAKVDEVGGAEREASGASSKPLTRIGAVIGTPDYMSPEQAFGLAIDARSDLYSLGVILFEMLSGAPPFRGDAVTVLRQHVVSPVPPITGILPIDPRVDAIMRKLLEKEATARFQSAKELVAAMDELEAPSVPLPTGALAAHRATLHSVSGVTTPAASTAIAWPTITLPTWVPPWATPQVLAAGAAGIVLLFIVAAVARPSPTLLVARSFEVPSAPFLQAIDDAAPPDLPPPPAASASASARAASAKSTPPKQQQQPSRHTGPGGIYIPSPSQWFK